MKLIMENWRGYLNEIGEASIPPYEFELASAKKDRVVYVFNTEGEEEGASGLEYEFIFDLEAAPSAFMTETELGSGYFKNLISPRKDFEPAAPTPMRFEDPSKVQIEWGISYNPKKSFVGRFISSKYKETGEGKPLRIMSTAAEIIKDFIKNSKINQKERFPGQELRFVFFGTPSAKERSIAQKKPGQGLRGDEALTGRTKLYKKFLKNQLPDVELIERGDNPNWISFKIQSDDASQPVDAPAEEQV